MVVGAHELAVEIPFADRVRSLDGVKLDAAPDRVLLHDADIGLDRYETADLPRRIEDRVVGDLDPDVAAVLGDATKFCRSVATRPQRISECLIGRARAFLLSSAAI